MKISIICPTRKRHGAMMTSLQTLWDTWSTENAVEICLAFDEDDQETAFALDQSISDRFADWELRYTIVERFGYKGLHKYVNILSEMATGDWLLLWNDDALMETPGWDKIIAEYNGQFVLLGCKCSTPIWQNYPLTLFPVYPKKWVEVVGHVSNNAHNDTWLSHVAQMTGTFVNPIPVSIFHDRADVAGTGNNNDETFQEGKKGYDLSRYDSQAPERREDADKIRRYLEGD